MGGLFSNARAQNELDSVINAGISVVNKSVQSCSSPVGNVADYTIVAENGSTVNIGELNTTQAIKIDTNCVANNSTSTQLSQDIQNQMAQTAAATVGALSMGSTDANNYINSVTNLSQEISNTFIQKCSPAITNQAALNIKATNNSQIYAAFINTNQSIDATTQCMQTTVANSQAAQDLKQSVDQSATAKNEGLLDAIGLILAILGVIAIIIIIVVIVIAIPKGGGGSSKTSISVSPGMTTNGTSGTSGMTPGVSAPGGPISNGNH